MQAGQEIRARGRPRAADAADRRAELMEIAARTFLAQGYDGTSMDAIAATARVSKATIYARFASKENLFYEISLHAVSRMRGDLLDIATEGRSPEDVLFDYAIRIAGEVADPDQIAMLRLAIAGKPRFPEIARTLHDHIADTVKPLTRYLQALKASTMPAMGDPAEAARHFINLANGGLRFLLTDDFASPAFRKRWSRDVVRLFLSGARGG